MSDVEEVHVLVGEAVHGEGPEHRPSQGGLGSEVDPVEDEGPAVRVLGEPCLQEVDGRVPMDDRNVVEDVLGGDL